MKKIKKEWWLKTWEELREKKEWCNGVRNERNEWNRKKKIPRLLSLAPNG